MFCAQLRRQPLPKLLQKFPAIRQVALPILGIHAKQFVQRLRRNLQPIQRQPRPRRHVADRRFLRLAAPFHVPISTSARARSPRSRATGISHPRLSGTSSREISSVGSESSSPSPASAQNNPPCCSRRRAASPLDPA